MIMGFGEPLGAGPVGADRGGGRRRRELCGCMRGVRMAILDAEGPLRVWFCVVGENGTFRHSCLLHLQI